MSVYIRPSAREREKEKRNDRQEKKMSKQLPPAPTARAVGPCSTLIQISRTPRNWKFTQHYRTTKYVWLVVFGFNCSYRVFQSISGRLQEGEKEMREKCPNNPHPHLAQAQWALALLPSKLVRKFTQHLCTTRPEAEKLICICHFSKQSSLHFFQ